MNLSLNSRNILRKSTVKIITSYFLTKHFKDCEGKDIKYATRKWRVRDGSKEDS